MPGILPLFALTPPPHSRSQYFYGIFFPSVLVAIPPWFNATPPDRIFCASVGLRQRGDNGQVAGKHPPGSWQGRVWGVVRGSLPTEVVTPEVLTDLCPTEVVG